MKYIKEFQNHTAYVAFTGTSEYVLPNVSLCDQENEVHFSSESPVPSGPSIATFKVTSTSNPTRILHTTSGISGVEIDGVEQPTVETGYTFSTTGEHTVKYTFSTNTTYENWQFCTNLVSMNISNSIVTIGKNAFEECLSLRTVTIPNSVTSIGESAFWGCTSLTSITVNRTTPSALGRGAFDNTKNCPIYVPSGSVDTYKSEWSTYESRIRAIP